MDGRTLCSCDADSVNPVCVSASEHGLPTLHKINKLDPDVRKLLLQFMNRLESTRTGASSWVPGNDDCVCNVHFPDFRGPSQGEKRRFPIKSAFIQPKKPGCGIEYYPKPRLSFAAPRKDRKRTRNATTLESDVRQEVDVPGDVNLEACEFVPETVTDTIEEFDDSDLLSVSSLSSRQSSARIDRTKVDLIAEISELSRENQRLQSEISYVQSTASRTTREAVLADPKFYTGLKNREFLDTLFEWIESEGRNVDSGPLPMNRSDKFLVVLMRLRLGLLQKDLACRWAVSQSCISKVLGKWIPFLARQLEQLIQWPQSTTGVGTGLFEIFLTL